jgi:hypothetical protein
VGLLAPARDTQGSASDSNAHVLKVPFALQLRRHPLQGVAFVREQAITIADY